MGELSELTYFGPKYEAEIGARRRVRTVLSVWIEPVDQLLCPHRRVRTRGVCLGRPAEARPLAPTGMVQQIIGPHSDF
jgi:hypothetical protein